MHKFAPVLIATLMSSTAFAAAVFAQQASGTAGDECQNLAQLVEQNTDTLPAEWVNQANAAVQAGDAAQCAALREQAVAEYNVQDQAAAQPGAAAQDATQGTGAAAGAGTDIQVTEQQQQVSVDQGAPEITVRQGAPVVRVQMPQPVITIDMPQPEIIVRMPDPNVQVTTQEPQIEVRQGEPVITYERADPTIEIESEGEPQVQFNQTGEPTVSFEQQGAQQQPAADQQQPAAEQQPATDQQPAADQQQAGDQEAVNLILVTDQTVEPGQPTAYAATDIIGQPLVNARGESLGTVERVVTVDGRNYVVLGADSPLSDGQGGVVLPLEHVSLIEGQLTFRGLTQQELEQLQQFDGTGAQDLGADQQIEIGTR
jgi:ribosomal 30S subunit maturation factor RimM